VRSSSPAAADSALWSRKFRSSYPACWCMEWYYSVPKPCRLPLEQRLQHASIFSCSSYSIPPESTGGSVILVVGCVFRTFGVVTYQAPRPSPSLRLES
jgi:hypothetical protein